MASLARQRPPSAVRRPPSPAVVAAAAATDGGGRARQIVAVRRRPHRPINLHCGHGVPIFIPLFQLELERLVEESIQKKRKGRKSQFLFTAQLLGKWNLFRDFQRVQIYSIAHKKQKRT
jgi:hypothetical protein